MIGGNAPTRMVACEPTSRRNPETAAASRRHLLTVVLEDYFHVAPLKSVVQADQWYRFDRRVEANTRRLSTCWTNTEYWPRSSSSDRSPTKCPNSFERWWIAVTRWRAKGITTTALVISARRNSGTMSPDRGRLSNEPRAPRFMAIVSVTGGLPRRICGPSIFLRRKGLLTIRACGHFSEGTLRSLGGENLTLHRHNGDEIWEFPLGSWTLGWLVAPHLWWQLLQAVPALDDPPRGGIVVKKDRRALSDVLSCLGAGSRSTADTRGPLEGEVAAV